MEMERLPIVISNLKRFFIYRVRLLKSGTLSYLGGGLFRLATSACLLLLAGGIDVLPQLGLADALLAVQSSVNGRESLQLLVGDRHHAVA